MIPIFYRIWVTDSKLIQLMKESALPDTEALELSRKYVGSMKKYFKRMMIYVLIFLIGAGIVLFASDFLPNEAYVLSH